MNKKQKTLILVAGIISVILAAALIYYFKQQKEKNEKLVNDSNVYPAMPQVTDTGLVMPSDGGENGGCPAGYTLDRGFGGGFMCYPPTSTAVTTGSNTGAHKDLVMPLPESTAVVNLAPTGRVKALDFSKATPVAFTPQTPAKRLNFDVAPKAELFNFNFGF